MSGLSDDEIAARFRELLAQEAQEEPCWWYLSFADDEGFLGVCVVKARGMLDAIRIAHAKKINPGGEVMAIPLPADMGDPPEGLAYKLYTDKAEIERVMGPWAKGDCS